MRDCASANLRSNTYIEIIAIHVRDTLILIFTSYDFHRLIPLSCICINLPYVPFYTDLWF